MRYTKKEIKEAEENGKWPPPKYKCTKCGDILQSKYPGHYVECSCGTCMVDCTPDYVRLGGGKFLIINT